MQTIDATDDRFSAWIAALETRYLRDLTFSEVARALRALSSCYVERRNRLAAGDALGSTGKRAAFALFYAPLHFLVTRAVVRAAGVSPVAGVTDLGCGTGAAGAAWAIEAGGVSIAAFDRHPWAVGEAAWTYRRLGLSGKARQSDVTRLPLRIREGSGVIAAYCLNELPTSARATLLPRLLTAATRNRARLVIVEPIARKTAPWWDEWAAAFAEAGGQATEWRFPASLPDTQERLGRAAGLRPNELTARSLIL